MIVNMFNAKNRPASARTGRPSSARRVSSTGNSGSGFRGTDPPPPWVTEVEEAWREHGRGAPQGVPSLTSLPTAVRAQHLPTRINLDGLGGRDGDQDTTGPALLSPRRPTTARARMQHDPSTGASQPPRDPYARDPSLLPPTAPPQQRLRPQSVGSAGRPGSAGFGGRPGSLGRPGSGGSSRGGGSGSDMEDDYHHSLVMREASASLQVLQHPSTPFSSPQKY